MPSVLNMKASGTQVLGIQDLRAKLLALPDKMAKKIVKKAMLDGARVIRDEAKRLAPVRSGTLKKRIVAQRMKSRDKNEIRAVVTIRKPTKSETEELSDADLQGGATKGAIDPRRYGHLVEFGTQPHTVGKGSSLQRVGRKGKLYKTEKQFGAQHPGAKAKPYMRPAFDTKKGEAVDKIVDSLRTQLDAEVKASASSTKAGAA